MKKILLTLTLLIAGTSAFADGKTREQVKAELAAAVASGDIIGDNESGLKLNEIYPHKYNKVMTSSKTREEVKAELSHAIKTGNVIGDNESGLTLKEMYPNKYK